jgi:type VI secretion system secreted protein Hcp
MAHVDYFLKVEGIDGEAQDAAFAKCIDVQSWSWGETNAGAHGHGGGGGAGKVAVQDFHFVMLMNKASASLAAACAGGKHIPSAELCCRKAGDKPQVFLKIKLTDLLVSSYQTGGSAHGEIVPTDQISLNFSKIDFQYGEQDSKGTVAGLKEKFIYDVKKNVLS